MLDLLKEELDKRNLFDYDLPDVLQSIVNSINNNTIPERMKLTIAVSELVTFASQFRRNIAHWNGSQIPVNAITFCISASGTGKDSGANAARKCFREGYDLIEERRKTIAKQNAIYAAQKDGLKNPTDWNVYKKFYQTPNPLFVAPSTVEGFIQHLNTLDSMGIGAGFIYSGEFGAELANKPLLVENIQLLAELYDEGNKEVKVLKSVENQSREIKSLPVSALLSGSQDNILFDEYIKKIFRREFSTKLARRSNFNFNFKPVPPVNYPSVKAMLDAELAEEEASFQARREVSQYIVELTMYLMESIGSPIGVEQEVREAFTIYKRYNETLASTIKPQYPISKIVRTHMQWKALKIAGAFAIMDGEDNISMRHYGAAVSYVEMLDEDMQMFEAELVKEPYEIFVDFMKSQAVEGQASLSLHMLRKLGYTPKTGNPKTKMKELVDLATSLDPEGIYDICDDGICYEAINFTNISGVSFVEVSGTKHEKKVACEEGYEFTEIEFENLDMYLRQDCAFTPFKFKHGKRLKSNIESGCKWIYIDVDEGTMTDEEMHYILGDINHHIARTSNEDNAFKYRILLELDAMVDVPDVQWKTFIGSICDMLGIKADLIPKSQVAFGYEGRTVLSKIDGNTISVKEHLLTASEYTKKRTDSNDLSDKQKKNMLNDPLTTFKYAFEAKDGEGARSLIRAAYHAYDLGMDKEGIKELMYEISDYWDEPFPEGRMEGTIISQIDKWED